MKFSTPFTAKRVKKSPLDEKVKDMIKKHSEPEEEVEEEVSYFKAGDKVAHNDFGVGFVDGYTSQNKVACIFGKSKRVVEEDTLTKAETIG